ncbi:hypothetical protein [Streptomyces sp. WMMB303]|uniref:hypothetical protein n=1 Tax=Streptomyces sp. WMMB303 TaxID=3034154 RepID=UPI0023EB0F8D|nr:hypothetical protein [Streptomyces sp. WMMB303]MDF4254562.1 hypothetical protein [Streptomyces sp. WMMB303]
MSRKSITEGRISALSIYSDKKGAFLKVLAPTGDRSRVREYAFKTFDLPMVEQLLRENWSVDDSIKVEGGDKIPGGRKPGGDRFPDAEKIIRISPPDQAGSEDVAVLKGVMK